MDKTMIFNFVPEGDGDSGGSDVAQLIVISGGQAGKTADLRLSPTRIGRQDDCDLVLDSVTVSRHHAYVVREGEFHYVVDDGSRNGVFLNSRRIPAGEKQLLAHGDEIGLGGFVLLFKQPETAPQDQSMLSISLDGEEIKKEVEAAMKQLKKPDARANEETRPGYE